MPEFNLVKNNLLQLGSMAVGISGSGPTIFSVCDNLDIAKKVEQYLNENYLQSKAGFVYICQTDQVGARKLN